MGYSVTHVATDVVMDPPVKGRMTTEHCLLPAQRCAQLCSCATLWPAAGNGAQFQKRNWRRGDVHVAAQFQQGF